MQVRNMSETLLSPNLSSASNPHPEAIAFLNPFSSLILVGASQEVLEIFHNEDYCEGTDNVLDAPV